MTNLLEATTPSPIEYPHAREIAPRTLVDIAEGFENTRESLRIEDGDAIQVTEGFEAIRVNDTELVCDDDSLDMLASWCDFPKPFLKRLDPARKLEWLNSQLAHTHETAIVRVGDRDGMTSILSPEQIEFNPAMIVQVAQNVLGEAAPVVSLKSDATEFFLDVVTTPEVMRDLGDPQIGDITKAGLRFSMNTARNLAPSVNPYSYRLWCTNGCSSVHEASKMDARGLDVDEVMAELEMNARFAFGQVESDIEAMYDLRNEVVDNPERTIARIAREFDVPDRTRVRLVDSIPALVDTLGGEVTMFDLIQTATHMANAPEVKTRGQRETLENLGGSVIASHVERCMACQAKLN